MSVCAFDHAAMPIADVDRMLLFYEQLGFVVNRDGEPNYCSIHFGDNKINLHLPRFWRSEAFTLRGPTAVPGCGDFCFVWQGSQASLDTLLTQHGVSVLEGPVERVGGAEHGRARGQSTYVRDPDGNLLEFIIYPSAPT